MLGVRVPEGIQMKGLGVKIGPNLGMSPWGRVPDVVRNLFPEKKFKHRPVYWVSVLVAYVTL